MSDRLSILSRSDDPFMDRTEAGDLLGQALHPLAGPQTIVLGIPRGGLVVAREVARRIHAPLDMVLSRKLRAPDNPELAIGSIAETGEFFLDARLAGKVGADEEYVKREKQNQLREINRRRETYRLACPKIDVLGKDVIVVDDGIATGSTVQAAFWSIGREKPNRLIGAFPVGPEKTLRVLAQSVDQVICLKVPPKLVGVGRFYIHFAEISDEDVLKLLRECGGHYADDI